MLWIPVAHDCIWKWGTALYLQNWLPKREPEVHQECDICWKKHLWGQWAGQEVENRAGRDVTACDISYFLSYVVQQLQTCLIPALPWLWLLHTCPSNKASVLTIWAQTSGKLFLTQVSVKQNKQVTSIHLLGLHGREGKKRSPSLPLLTCPTVPLHIKAGCSQPAPSPSSALDSFQLQSSCTVYWAAIKPEEKSINQGACFGQSHLMPGGD